MRMPLRLRLCISNFDGGRGVRYTRANVRACTHAYARAYALAYCAYARAYARYARAYAQYAREKVEIRF